MRIPKRALLDRTGNHFYVVPAIALSLFIFAYSIHLGPISILAFYALWLPIFLLEPWLLLRDFHRVAPILILPLFATMSAGWSDVPSTTLRASVQYGSTFFCGLVAARLVSVPNLALGGGLGGLAVLVFSAINGSYSYDYIDGSYAFRGAFASKNQLGYFATLTLLFALAIVWLYKTSSLWRVLAAGTGVLAAALLRKSDSATSLIALMIALAALLAARWLVELAPKFRQVGIAVLLLATVAMIASTYSSGSFDNLLAAFGRDPTLTGRTYLWQQGIEFGMERPWFGLGYYAFWTHGRTEAEVLWEQFYIASRSGFTFHNLYIEAFVALGLFGVALVVGVAVTLIVGAALTLVQAPTPVSSLLCAALALLFVVRSFVELEYFMPYTISSFLVPFIILSMADRYAAGWRDRPSPRDDMQWRRGRWSA